MATLGEVLWLRLGRWARAARVGEQTQIRPVEISAALGCLSAAALMDVT